jgi:hypothetical protein
MKMQITVFGVEESCEVGDLTVFHFEKLYCIGPKKI